MDDIGIIQCPHCGKQALFETMPEGYATKRWNGARKEEAYLRCAECTATFPKRAVEDWQGK